MTFGGPAFNLCLHKQQNSLPPHGKISPDSKVMGEGTVALAYLWFLEATNIHQNMSILNSQFDLEEST